MKKAAKIVVSRGLLKFNFFVLKVFDRIGPYMYHAEWEMLSPCHFRFAWISHC